MPLSTTVFRNGRFFSTTESKDGNPQFQTCMVVENGSIKHLGAASDLIVANILEKGAASVDLGDKVVLPGFIDGHMHLLLLGQSLQKLDLTSCQNLEEIRAKIKAYATEQPSAARILCRGWMHSMTNGKALASMIDDFDQRPIFIDSKDLHSTWCNSAALKELGDGIIKDEPGAVIQRDEDGNATGLLSEAAVFTKVWPHLATVASMDEKLTAIRKAIQEYLAAGYTGVIDMAMDENGWKALLHLRSLETIPMHISAYWLITPADNEEDCVKQVDKATKLANQYNTETSPDLRVVGIKVICDGVIDGCTAALLEPYATGESCDPLWKESCLTVVAQHADSAGLQVAFHAIGDQTVNTAINTIERYCTRDLRPRIEHLEITTKADAQRLGKLGITASIQPVHADPAILRAWPKLLGGHRLARAFAYREFADGGAPLAIGSDSPTAPYAPFKNLYTATTRRSAREPELRTTVNENFALSFCSAISAANFGAAYSAFGETEYGSLGVGKRADFVVVDMDLTVEKLLEARVSQTYVGGSKVFDVVADS